MPIVSMHEAKTRLSQLVAQVEAGGDEVVIARGKVPAARIVAIARVEKPRRKAGSMKGLIAFDERFVDSLPDDELALWNGEGD